MLKRASAIAPTRGDAFDKMAGILLTITKDQCVVMAGDTTVFFMEAIACDSDGDAVWRIPSLIIASTVGKLPMGSGSQVTFEDEPQIRRITMRYKRTVAKINMLDPAYYPSWEPFSEDGLVEVMNLGAKIKQVMWAAGDDPSMNGVMLHSDCVAATNRYRLAKCDMATGMESDDLFLVPARTLTKILPDEGSVRIGRIPGAMLIMPNEFTQIRCATIEDGLLDVRKPLSRNTFGQVSEFDKTEFIQMMNRTMDFTGGNRQSTVSFFIGDGQVALFMDNPELGLYGDVVDAHGSAESHGLIEIKFNPVNLRDAIATFPGNKVTIKYELVQEDKKRAVMFTNKGEYTSIVAPLSEPPKAQPQEEN